MKLQHGVDCGSCDQLLCVQLFDFTTNFDDARRAFCALESDDEKLCDF